MRSSRSPGAEPAKPMGGGAGKEGWGLRACERRRERVCVSVLRPPLPPPPLPSRPPAEPHSRPGAGQSARQRGRSGARQPARETPADPPPPVPLRASAPRGRGTSARRWRGAGGAEPVCAATAGGAMGVPRRDQPEPGHQRQRRHQVRSGACRRVRAPRRNVGGRTGTDGRTDTAGGRAGCLPSQEGLGSGLGWGDYDSSPQVPSGALPLARRAAGRVCWGEAAMSRPPPPSPPASRPRHSVPAAAERGGWLPRGAFINSVAIRWINSSGGGRGGGRAVGGVAGHLRGPVPPPAVRALRPVASLPSLKPRLKNNGNYGASLPKTGRLRGMAAVQSGGGAVGTARRWG